MMTTVLERSSRASPIAGEEAESFPGNGFPTDWPMVRLGELLTFSNGVNADKRAYGQGVPFVNVLEVITSSHLRASEIPGRVMLTRAQRETFHVSQGDLLFNRTSETQEEVGLSAVYVDDEPVVFGGFVIRGRPTSEALESRYAGYALRASAVRSQVTAKAQGAVRANIAQASLKEVLVPLPPHSEQCAIAEALSDVDGFLEALGALIAKKRAIKQGAVQQLLTGRSRLPGFSGAWETKRLDEIGEISGSGVDKKVHPDEVPVRLVNYLDVYRNTILTSDDLTHEVSASPEQARRCAVHRGDVFFTPTSEVPSDIARFAVATQDIVDGAYSYHLVRLRLRANWDIRFRAYAFGTKQFLDQARVAAEGSGTRYVITLPRFRALSVTFPPTRAEQAAIGTVLSDMDAELAALEAHRDKTRALKAGMMQQLLTGRTRLVEPAGARTGDQS